LNEKQSFISLTFLFHVCLVTDGDSFISSEPKTTDTCFDSGAFVGPGPFRIGSAWTVEGQRT